MVDDASAEKGIESPDVVDKYKSAAEIATSTVELLRRACYPGMKLGTLCSLGDKKIENSVAGVYTKAKTESGEKLEKGVAFPTCVSVNNCAAHCCPISTDPEAEIALSAGDVVTVHLGAHIDGYAALTAQTIVVREAKEQQSAPALTGRAAAAVAAAYTASEAALRVMRPGNTNTQVTEVIGKVASNYGVSVLEGVMSHQVKRYVVDGAKAIANKFSHEQRVEEWKFEENEVYNLDILMSTGEGKAKEMSTKETVYKRQVDVDYKLKLKTSRQIFSVINKKYPVLPFTLRALGDEPKKSRMAVTEMMNHNLLVSYPVVYEREGETVTRCSVTVLVLPSQTMRITTATPPLIECGIEVVDAEVKALLATSLGKKKKKKGKKRPAAGSDAMDIGE